MSKRFGKENHSGDVMLVKLMTDIGSKHLEIALGLTELVIKSGNASEVFSAFEQSIDVVKENFPLSGFLERSFDEV